MPPALTRLSQTCCGQQTCRTLLYISNVNSRVETYAGCSAAGLLISQRNGEVGGQTDGHQTNAYTRAERSLHFWLICYLDTLGIISHSGLCHTTFTTFSSVFTCAMLCIHSTSHWPVSVCLSVTSRSCVKRAERIGLFLTYELPSAVLHCVKGKFGYLQNPKLWTYKISPVCVVLLLQTTSKSVTMNYHQHRHLRRRHHMKVRRLWISVSYWTFQGEKSANSVEGHSRYSRPSKCNVPLHCHDFK